MKYNHPQIETTAGEVIVGGIYQYKEDSYIFDIEISKDLSSDEWISFEFKVLTGPYKDEVMNVSALRTPLYYGGMWRIMDQDTYLTDYNKHKIAHLLK